MNGRTEPQPVSDLWLWLPTLGVHVRATRLLTDDLAVAIAARDVCWEASWAAWEAACPHRWALRRRREWRRDRDTLLAERVSIRADAVRYCRIGWPIAVGGKNDRRL
jgi:hypothetical protein